jgi:hypothetical protein
MLPVAAFCKQIHQLLKPSSVIVIEAFHFGTVNVDDTDNLSHCKHKTFGAGTPAHLPIHRNWHNHLTLAIPVASDMTWEGFHIFQNQT